MSMTKLDVNIFLRLITAHTNNDEIAFKDICLDLCNKLDAKGDGELSSYIMAQLGLVPTFSPGGGELPTPEEHELDVQLHELIDAVWCSRGDNEKQNKAASDRADKARKNITGIFDSYANKKAERLSQHND